MVNRRAQEKIGNIIVPGGPHNDQVAFQLRCRVGYDFGRFAVIYRKVAAFGIGAIIPSQQGLDFLDIDLGFGASYI